MFRVSPDRVRIAFNPFRFDMMQAKENSVWLRDLHEGGTAMKSVPHRRATALGHPEWH